MPQRATCKGLGPPQRNDGRLATTDSSSLLAKFLAPAKSPAFHLRPAKKRGCAQVVAEPRAGFAAVARSRVCFGCAIPLASEHACEVHSPGSFAESTNDALSAGATALGLGHTLTSSTGRNVAVAMVLPTPPFTQRLPLLLFLQPLSSLLSLRCSLAGFPSHLSTFESETPVHPAEHTGLI